MSSFVDFVRRMGHRLCSKELPPDNYLFPQMCQGRESGDVRVFKKMVLRGRLAPFYPGFEDSNAAPGLEECPICCLYYRVMNKTKCCRQRICSECIARIQTASGNSLSGCHCPFCKKSGIHLEVCEGKTELEKEADRLEEQKFTEYCIRERGMSARGPTLTNHSANAGLQESTETGVPFSVANNTSPQITGESSSAPAVLEIPHNVQNEYQQEIEALYQRNPRPIPNSELSNLEIQHCSEFMGICPSDLGMRLDEFNDLLLEHVLISSMMDTRNTRQCTNDGYQNPQSLGDVLHGHAEQGGNQQCLNDQQEDDQEEQVASNTSVEAVANQLASSSLLSSSSSSSGSSQNSGGSSHVIDARQSSDDGAEETDGSSSTLSSRNSNNSNANPDSFGTVWGNFLNSLAEIGERNFHLRMIFVQCDDPQMNQQRLSGNLPSERNKTDESYNYVFIEDTQHGSGSSKATIAVQNPDGSLAVVLTEKEDQTGHSSTLTESPLTQTSEQDYSNPVDAAIVDVTKQADERQKQAIDSADERLRRLFNQ
eukprot:g192.t1